MQPFKISWDYPFKSYPTPVLEKEHNLLDQTILQKLIYLNLLFTKWFTLLNGLHCMNPCHTLQRQLFWCVRTWPMRAKVRSFSIIKPVNSRVWFTEKVASESLAKPFSKYSAKLSRIKHFYFLDIHFPLKTRRGLHKYSTALNCHASEGCSNNIYIYCTSVQNFPISLQNKVWFQHKNMTIQENVMFMN